jgi:hypothetical protein
MRKLGQLSSQFRRDYFVRRYATRSELFDAAKLIVF